MQVMPNPPLLTVTNFEHFSRHALALSAFTLQRSIRRHQLNGALLHPAFQDVAGLL
jgi:hypothetical protein